MTIRVVIADDHRIVRDGLCYLLSQEPDVEVAGEAGDGQQTVDVVAATRPDVLLLDLYMPGLDGHAVLTALRAAPARRHRAHLRHRRRAPRPRHARRRDLLPA
ncbi:MAG TPA: response regulator [Streptosporangiaceae bacterium]